MVFFKSAALFILLFCLCFQNNGVTLCMGGSRRKSCIGRERLALMEFKDGLSDPHHLLSSWTGYDCCGWRGVKCDNETGNVVTLDIGYHFLHAELSEDRQLGGEVNPSLLELEHLRYLDLSSNDFRGIRIPGFFGSLTKLSYLNLSNSGFGGIIPHELGNLSSLQYLDLNSFYSSYELNADNLQWLTRLSTLQYLDMSRVNLGKASDWFDLVNMLPSLSVLLLPWCQLRSIPSPSHLNLTSLAIIDLESNDISSTFPSMIFNFSRLEHLNLGFNHFDGFIPDNFDKMASLETLELAANGFVGVIPKTIARLCNLRYLDLSSNNLKGVTTDFKDVFSGCVGKSLEVLNVRNNNLEGNLSDWLGLLKRLVILDIDNNLFYGPIPASVGKLSSLKILFLGHNGLNGTLPESIGQLSQLNLLDVSFNSLEGVVKEAHFVNLSRLEELSMSLNSLVLNVSSDWVPPFHLKAITLQSCRIGPRFPAWLQTQKDFSVLDLSNTGIVDTLPDWFWGLSYEIVILDLSHNCIRGKVPSSLKYASISIINLSSNKFEGPLPSLPSDLEYLDLSNNSFSGTILPIIGDTSSLLTTLDLSLNLVNGTIPASLCKLHLLEVIDVSSNFLYGELPSCWTELANLMALNLGNNNISGEIQSSLGSLRLLQALHLQNNSLSGEIPSSLKHCKNLVAIDLGENNLSGIIPTWIGEALPFLTILRLRSNLLHGHIPEQLSQLTALQILDLADNRLSGAIPQGFGNFSAMTVTHKPGESILDSIQSSVLASVGNYAPLGYIESLLVVIKGRELEYTKTLQYVASMDLSGNDLSGNIPEHLCRLHGLQNLNLSSNQLTGNIPDKISDLQLLESLDLSRNKLSGAIPPSLSALTSLSHLNLSYNSLSGRIPSGYQLQTLDDPSIYAGNIGLCGLPLNKKCDENKTEFDLVLTCDDGNNECGSEKLGLYLAMIIGFFSGIWAIFGTLMLHETWRSAYFQFIDCLIYRFLETVVSKLAHLQEHWRNTEVNSFEIEE